MDIIKKATPSEIEKFRINNETGYHVFGFSFTVKKVTLHFTLRDGPIIPENTSVVISTHPNETKQSASGVYLDNNAISYSFDFAVAADKEFELSLRNRSHRKLFKIPSWEKTGKFFLYWENPGTGNSFLGKNLGICHFPRFVKWVFIGR